VGIVTWDVLYGWCMNDLVDFERMISSLQTWISEGIKLLFSRIELPWFFLQNGSPSSSSLMYGIQLFDMAKE